MTDLTPTTPSSSTATLPEAVLWDMDGTIVDTEPYWMRAETELIESYGGTWTHDDGLTVVGMGLRDAATIFQSRGVTLAVDDIIQWMTTRVLEQVAVEVPWRPGARELLADLREHGVRTALVTMSVHRMAVQIVEAIGFDAFDVVVGGDDVELPKPHPAPYLHAAALLGVPIERCVAIEDSAPGLASAVASGAATIAIPLHAALPDDGTHTQWTTLAGRSTSDIAAVFSAHTAAAIA
ncbi:HAD family hydrolase [Marisediminicola sp. LYQ134]|uniref:HAD family hydrolase n=1 Tax=Marisediminicola sp. LYQ134 TaxID=3391061 RepID=UPI003983AD0F